MEAFGDGGWGAVFISQDAAEEGFSRSSNQKREIGEGGDELIEFGDEFDVLLLALAEADARIDDD